MNKLKELRTEKGLLQSDIAKIINKSERTVGFYETGERDMGTETLSILADFFDVTIDYLLGKTEVRNAEEANFQFAFHKDIDTKGLTKEDIKEALEIYRMLKKRNEENKK